MKEKEIFDRSAIMKDIDALTQKSANDEGYANAEVVPLTNVHDKEQLVDVTYRMTQEPVGLLLTGSTSWAMIKPGIR